MVAGALSNAGRTTKSVRSFLVLYVWSTVLPVWAAQSSEPVAPAPCLAEQSKSALASSVLHPIWEGWLVDGETALFQLEAGSSQPAARLLFQPTRISKITSANGKILFEEGRDYRWQRDTNVLELPPGSRIPSRSWNEMHPALSAETALGEAVGGKTSLLFDRPGNLFQSLQVAVSYEHRQPWSGYIPKSARGELSRTFQLLQSRRPLTVVVLGDSISFGSGSSSDFRQAPCQPPYAELVADGLEQRYGSSVALRNLSVGGKSAAWGVEMAARVVEEKPDLVVIAFGMNDASGRRSAESYSNDIQKIMQTVRSSAPSTEFILVATMSGNAEWSRANPALYLEYRDALQRLLIPGIAMADMTSFSEDVLRTKTFADITANGVNHPNDFGHRLYAQVILALLH
ncbi:MAG: GDSL-like Lipase/Acylhydrolase [Acidobacteriaceae bacterium]|nr:GDSL-like Lipase/Acylhydrolase [Acidobacteriaceae bacterium]